MLLPLDGAALELPRVPVRLGPELDRVQPRPRAELGVPERRTEPVRLGLVRGALTIGVLGVDLGAVRVSVGPGDARRTGEVRVAGEVRGTADVRAAVAVRVTGEVRVAAAGGRATTVVRPPVRAGARTTVPVRVGEVSTRRTLPVRAGLGDGWRITRGDRAGAVPGRTERTGRVATVRPGRVAGTT